MLIQPLSVRYERAHVDTAVISTAWESTCWYSHCQYCTREHMLIQPLSVLHERAHVDTAVISTARESTCWYSRYFIRNTLMLWSWGSSVSIVTMPRKRKLWNLFWFTTGIKELSLLLSARTIPVALPNPWQCVPAVKQLWRGTPSNAYIKNV